MRSTLDLDDDVLQATRALAEQRGVPVDVVITELLRERLALPPADGGVRNGIRLFPVSPGAGTVTPEIVRALLDERE